ncbi:MAG: SigE family RNA polymerase sigma factor [Catenulispora sp.]|nr:SigE family RNA polymerase sigma factor [Catenulispora sp.]
MVEDPIDAEFGDFMAARWPALVRTAYLLTGDQHLAEDLAQATLTKVYASWKRVRRADDIDAYVRRVLVNTNAGRFRKRRVAEHLVAAPYDGRGHEPHEPLAQRTALMAALAALPGRQRAVVVLRYWEDLSEREVAAILGCSQGTVKSQAAKALARLRTAEALHDARPGGDPVTARRTGKDGR